MAALSALDAAAFGEDGDAHAGYRDLKALMLRLYSASEIGASQELIYDPVPGEWIPCPPFEEVGRTWAT